MFFGAYNFSAKNLEAAFSPFLSERYISAYMKAGFPLYIHLPSRATNFRPASLESGVRVNSPLYFVQSLARRLRAAAALARFRGLLGAAERGSGAAAARGTRARVCKEEVERQGVPPSFPMGLPLRLSRARLLFSRSALPARPQTIALRQSHFYAN